ncbi:MAG: DNA translocase FtsK [Syntrophales bacterium]
MKGKGSNFKRSREIGAIVIFALAVFLFLCFVSYSPRDPSFSNEAVGLIHINNFGGIVGSYVADAFIRILGISAAWLPLVLFMVAFKLFMREDFKIGLVAGAGFAGLILSTSGFLDLACSNFRLIGTDYPPGGILGAFLANFLTAYLNSVGTGIFLVTVFLISLMITVDLSFASFIVKVLNATDRVVQLVKSFIAERVEDFRMKRQKLRERKLKAASPPPVIVEGTAPSVPDRRPRRKKAEQVTLFDEFDRTKTSFNLPPISLLDDSRRKDTRIKKESLLMNAKLLEKKLADFAVDGKVVEVKPGPLITMYELEPAPGVKINRITNLADDLAMALKAPSVRIAPIPGKSVVGIEIPNYERDPVHLKNVLDSEMFRDSKLRLPIALGEDTVGSPVIADLARMPHLLIAGTTGSGKSVSLNAMICSILFKATPEEVKFLMIDPKRLEMSAYEGIPHLLHPVVINPKDASQVLKWAVCEMERRYRIIGEVGVKSIEKFNRLAGRGGVKEKTPSAEAVESDPEMDEDDNDLLSGDFSGSAKGGVAHPAPFDKLPYIIIVIDELADLMMVAQRNVEESLTRLAQMARAAGIHLILATQRPSVDVITGIIKANFPTRISFQVSSKVDSRTILDQLGAEQLLGMGDMLFLPPGSSRLVRIHGAYVSDREIERVVDFIKKQGRPRYDETILQEQPAAGGDKPGEDYDEKYDEAVELVTDLGQASISLVQRYMKIGYNRAARIIEKMEAEGIVGPSDGIKPRKVLVKKL